MAMRRLEDSHRGRILAGLAFGLRCVARPQADGLNAQKIIVRAGHGAGFLLRLRQHQCQQSYGQNCKKSSHHKPHYGLRRLYILEENSPESGILQFPALPMNFARSLFNCLSASTFR